ncbi:MAG: cytochrome c [Beijerinckiaceae bacterium]|nr:cytochrome c [Beijerinckiaceae bacterium]
MKSVILAAATLAVFASGALAQSDPAKERSATMRGMQDKGFNPLRAMARGQSPYDKAAVEAAYKVLDEGTDKVVGLWPANSPSNPEGRFGSSPKVWESKADFDAKLASSHKIILASRADALSGLDGLKGAVEKVDASCNACHETYRVRLR